MASKALQRRATDLAFAIMIAGAVGYFALHAVQGESGLFVKLAIETEERRLTTELDVLKARRATLENLTYRLSDRFLDIELLDERARDVLGYVRPDEVVIR